MSRILVVDDEENLRKVLATMLRAEGFDPVVASSIGEAKKRLSEGTLEVLLTDLKLEGEWGGELLTWVKTQGLFCPVIFLTAHGTIDSAVDAMKQGAFDYVSKPFDRNELVRTLKRAVRVYQFQNQHSIYQISKQRDLQYPIIGKSESIRKVMSLLQKVAPTNTTVLIQGESGTGKELIAEALHRSSDRDEAPFIKINCAAIPENLMESELFGYERGAFTGAVTSKPGRFELAHGGTLFLDEIAEMNTEMQVKLLRVLQDKSFERVGGIKNIKVDVRLIAATNRDLDIEVKEGRFRADLFYRLNVVPIHLPPLRKRPDDIPLLVRAFVDQFGERLKRPSLTIQPEVLDLLSQFPWPGNIRQLENVIERVMVMTENNVFGVENLPEDILEYEERRFEEESNRSQSLKERVKDVTRRIEKEAIESALEATSNNITQAARLLNISRKGLQLKIKELGLR